MKTYSKITVAAASTLAAASVLAASYMYAPKPPIIPDEPAPATNGGTQEPTPEPAPATNGGTQEPTPGKVTEPAPQNPPTKTPAVNKPPAATPPRPSAANVEEVMAWIYPGKEACGAKAEYSDGRKINVLKPQYFTVSWDGSLNLITEKEYGCNGYSERNVADLKKYSSSQYVTVASGDASGMVTFLSSALADGDSVDRLVSFVSDNGLTGIELDFEDYGNWNKSSYESYKAFLQKLGSALHAKGKKFMIDGPATSNATEEAWYIWRYSDFLSLPVDKIVVMTYDHQYDQGSGKAIAPPSWIKSVVDWTLSRFPEKNRLSFGIASYAYKAAVGSQKFKLLTYEQIRAEPGFSGATRDPDSHEMSWRNENYVYVYNDWLSMAKKLQTIKDTGVNSVSVWHLGGNQWFR